MRTPPPVASLLLSTLSALACVPNLGNPASLVTSARVLAVRGTPPEAAPGAMVQYDLLVASPQGTVQGAEAIWSYCDAARPPADNNVVSNTCLEDSAQTELAGPATTYAADVPSDACQLFGPDAPSAMPGQLPPRPADPDVTGGYYQPVRVKPSGISTDGVATFALERVTCNLPSAPVDVSQAFAKDYKPNTNPVLTTVTAALRGSAPELALGGETPGTALTVPSGAAVELDASWTAASRESFPVYDPVSLTLVTQAESLRLSWFATAGAFTHDVTGTTETETATDTTNQWTAPKTPGTVHFWVVLRDDRGGVDFGGFDIMVQS